MPRHTAFAKLYGPCPPENLPAANRNLLFPVISRTAQSARKKREITEKSAAV